jgi:hypothetical protein
MYEQAETPTFSWSHSRERTLRECERKYFWHYYGSHNGWLDSASQDARLAYRLKQLTDLPLLLGQAVHERAKETARALQAGRRRPGLHELRERTRADLNRAWASSKRDRETFLLRPKAVPMLLPIYYDRAVGEDVIERTKQKLESCVRGLVATPVWDEVERCGPADLLVIDAVTSFTHMGIETYAAPDLLYRAGDTWIILDWKTGKPGPVEQQIAVYGLFLRHRVGDPEKAQPWVGRVVRVDTGDEHRILVGLAQLRQAERMIADGVARMAEFVVEEDLERNEAAPRDQFRLAENQLNCPRCRFYELCAPELAGLHT